MQLENMNIEFKHLTSCFLEEGVDQHKSLICFYFSLWRRAYQHIVSYLKPNHILDCNNSSLASEYLH